MRLEPIANYLQANGVGSLGQSLFIYGMPATVKQGVLLLEGLSGSPIDPYLPGFYRASFQAIVRDQTHDSGYLRAEQISELLTLKLVTLGDMEIRYCQPRHTPIVFPISEGDNLEISVNFDIAYVAT